jgi:hypothetical protein
MQNGRYSSLRSAARANKVSHETLWQRLKGLPSKKEDGVKRQLLSDTEETLLIEWITELTDRYIPAQPPMLNNMATTILRSREPPSTVLPGQTWCYRFIARKSDVKVCFSRQLDRAHAVAITKPLLGQWFDLYETVLRTYGITRANTWNMDETGYQMGVLGRTKIAIPRTEDKRYIQQPGEKSWASVLETINGCRKVLPPFLIFEGDHHQVHWYPCNRPEGWKFGISENGWTSNALALRWLTEHFEPLTRPASPSTKRLLILDGHGSHKSWEFLNFCRGHQIVVLCLPPHDS